MAQLQVQDVELQPIPAATLRGWRNNPGQIRYGHSPALSTWKTGNIVSSYVRFFRSSVLRSSHRLALAGRPFEQAAEFYESDLFLGCVQ